MSGQVDAFRPRITGHWGPKATFRKRPFIGRLSTHAPTLNGITRDSTGAALGNCAVEIFRTWDDVRIGKTTSDGAGNFQFFPTSSGPYYLVAYLPGSPDVAGTTVNTLTAA